jgi:DNA-binding NtrC family response regulator
VNLEEVERSLTLQALERTGWNMTHAGRLLGLSRDAMRYRVDKFQLRAGADDPMPQVQVDTLTNADSRVTRK